MKPIIVVGLSFGDEGKGSIIDSLTKETGAKLVVRFNGGAQAAHHVVKDGKTHCFSQFGSGTLQGARTHLSRYMMVAPIYMQREAEHLKDEFGITDPFSLVTVDPDAPIITPYHTMLNQLRETARGNERHGSCGFGIGELGQDIENNEEVLTAQLLYGGSFGEVRRCILRIQERLNERAGSDILVFDPPRKMQQSPDRWIEQARQYNPLLLSTEHALETQHGTVLFEGAQGVLLDERYGFHPHTTWSNCTFENAFTLLREADVVEPATKIGVVRSFATRHGVGPFPTERSLTPLPGEHNTYNQWQGSLRYGHFDLSLTKYAFDVCGGVDQLAVTHVDHIGTPWWVCLGYYDPIPLMPGDLHHQEHMGQQLLAAKAEYTCVNDSVAFISLLEETLAPVGVVSRGRSAVDKEYVGSLVAK